MALFQTYDDKKECVLVFYNNEFYKKIHKLKLSHTWSYSSQLEDLSIEYAQIWANGASLEAVCPPHLSKVFKKTEERLKAMLRACAEAHIDLTEVCFYDLVPRFFLREYAQMKNAISQYVFANYTRPQNHGHMAELIKVITDMKYRPLRLQPETLNQISIRDKNVYKTLISARPNIVYDPFKTVTGRLATAPRTFPILNLGHAYRRVVTPTNDWLLELDFNAAELRTALGLLGKEQPTEDIHEWHLKKMFKKMPTRDEAKKRVFAWLYNPASEDVELNKMYQRDAIKEKYFKDGLITTDFQRTIVADDYHAVNYIIQSSAADVLFEQMIKLYKLLKNKKSFVKFCNHDSVTIDLANEDQHLIHPIKEAFGTTRYGQFAISCTGGKTWGDMRPLRVL